MHLLEQYLVEERTVLLDEKIRLRVIGSRDFQVGGEVHTDPVYARAL